MKKLLLCFLFFACCSRINAQENLEVDHCARWAPWLRPACQYFVQLWTKGTTERYLSGYAWHNRYMYSRDRIKTYNELAWGGGLGKGLFDKDGDLHSLYALAFLDSHQNIEPVIGYSFLKTIHFGNYAYVGGGFAVLVTSRPDIFHYTPIPGLLPWVSVSYRRVSLCATYIPGKKNVGNVLFIIGKIAF